MLKNLKEKLIDTEEKKVLISNIFSLGVLQGVSYLLPLLTVPYLVRVLGPEYFGLIAFSSAVIMYFVLVTNYGFNLSATRQISIQRGDIDKIIEIFSSVMFIKVVLMFASLIFLCILVFFVEKIKVHWAIYFITFGMVVGQVFFPVWLFQGVEKMKYITYLNIFSKTIFTICIFLFVKEKSDYLYVPLFTSLGFVVVALLSLYYAKKDFGIIFRWPKKEQLKFQLIDGWHIFFSSIAISMYTVSTVFILGLFASNTVVGYFSAADKIIQAVKGIYQPVSQSIYPLVGRKFKFNKQDGLIFIRKITLFVGGVMFVLSSLIYTFSEGIVKFLLGAEYFESILLVKIMAFLPFIIALSNIYGVQIMLNLGFKVAFSRILVLAAILGIVLSALIVPSYKEIGSAYVLLTVEMFVTSIMWMYLKVRLKNE